MSTLLRTIINSSSRVTRILQLQTRTISTTRVNRMPSSDPNALNAAGMTPEESKALTERQPTREEEPIIKAIKEMYSCKPIESTYDIYAQNAVFHDPIGYAEGIGAVRAQFNGLAKIFPVSTVDTLRVLALPTSTSLPSSTILIDQTVSYYRKPPPAEPTKTVNSLLTIVRGADGKVERHTEEWGHQRETTGEDGFMGTLNQWRKQATAAMTGVAVGKDSAPPPKD